ncbi:hypothetical protein Tco_1180517, partial [Tanacetum coccineum]
MATFWVINTQFKQFIDSQFTLDYDSQMTDKYFAEYTGIKVKQFRETLLQHMSNVKKSVAERTCHQRQYDRRVNKRQMQTQESKVDLGKALDADLVVTESSGTESGKQDTSSRSGNDTNADNADIKPVYDEETMAEVQLTAECNVTATGQQHTNNKAKIKKEIDEPETMNIELEHSVAKLLKENETLKKHYKDLYDSIKITRSKTIEQTTSLLANNADLKAQIQEKVFAIDALKNELINSKGNSVDTKPQNTTNGSKQKLRSNNQTTRSLPASKSSCVTSNVVPLVDNSRNSSPFSDSKHFVCSRCHKYVFNANHDAFITKLLKEVNSRAKIQSYKTRNSNKPIDQKSHTQKPGRKIFTRHTFSPNKYSAMYEKTSPRSGLRWQPTGRIIKTVGL